MKGQNLNQLPPRKLVSFLSDFLTDNEFKNALRMQTEKCLIDYGISLDDSLVDKLINLTKNKKNMERISAYIENEKFAFPAQSNIQSGLPLAFAITVVFVFLPLSSPSQVKHVA